MIGDLLVELRTIGIELRLDGERLVCNAPKGALTPAVQERIRTHKAAIVALFWEAVDPFAELDRVKRAPSDQGAPLGLVQQRMWLLDRLEPGTTVYNLPGAWRLRGHMHVEAFEAALREVVRRHDVLRARIGWNGDAPVQIVAPDLPFDFPLIDLTPTPAPDREGELLRRLEVERDRLFDLERAPLFRAQLYRLRDDEHVFFFLPHHVIWDGWSWDILLAELAALYGAFSQNQPSPLSDVSIQYADIVGWHRDWMRGPELARQLNYWRQQLAGELPVLQLPTDRPRPPALGQRGIRRLLDLDSEMIARLRALGRGEGATLFMVLLAAYKILLHRYTDQRDIIVGAPVQDRLHPEAQHLIGAFVNTLVLRTAVEPHLTFRSLVRRVRDVCLGAYAHQDVPFDRLVEEFQPERSLSHTPLYQTLFTFQDVTNRPTALADLALSQVHVPTHDAPTDVLFGCMVYPDRTLGVFDFNADLFAPATMDRFVTSFATLLHDVATDPDKVLSAVEVLPPDERQRILVEWQGEALPVAEDAGLHDLVAAQASRVPEAVALVDGTTELTYADLERRANRLAHYLKGLGVGPEVLVGICLDRTADLVVSVLAVLKAGGAYVPIDPEYPAERIRFMLNDARAAVVVTHSSLDRHLQGHSSRVVRVDADAIATQQDTAPPSSHRGTDLAYVIYTSGSTGTPKGVAIEHRSAVALITWARGVYTTDEVSGVLAATSICFDLSVFELFVPLAMGGTVILASDAVALSTLPARLRVTLVNTVPSAMAELLRAGGIPRSVVTVNLAGEPLATSLVRDLYATGTIRRVYDLYGPSEDTTYSTWALRSPDGPATIGRPIANTCAYVLDTEYQPVPIGVTGEIHLGGMGLARGYLYRPELTAERFIADPFSPNPGARLYRTGDLARWRPEGTLEFLGRRDGQVKVRGFRIELGELETALTGHAAVREAAATVRSAADGGNQLVAYVVPAPGQTLTASTVRRFLRERLPRYMVPNLVLDMASLPRTPNGKVDRRALPDPFARIREAPREFEPPQTETERLLAEVWQRLLNVERVARQDNFFELGGHSLLSIRAVAEVREQLGRTLDPRVMFFQSLAQIAAGLGDGPAGPDSGA